MADIVQERVTTHQQGPTAARTTEVKSVATGPQTIEYLIYFIFGTLEVLLLFRLVLKLMGANPASAFVNFIYSLTGLFILPFEGIFRSGVSEGIETASVLEPSVLVALVVYAFVAWGIVMLVRILSREQQA